MSVARFNFIPNLLEFMHKIIATGVHEIAALVVPFQFAKRLGINCL